MNRPPFGWEDVHITTDDYAIGGKLITAYISIDDQKFHEIVQSPNGKDEIRKALVEQLAQEMLNKSLVEINQRDDAMTLRKVIVARAYVAPDSTVKILRTIANNKIL
jgi:hypothetical protein